VGTDGPSGGRYDAKGLVEAALAHWQCGGPPFVVCTGGEPLLQLDALLLDAFHAEGCVVAVETNGTLPVPSGVDWVTVSPKAGAAMRQVRCDVRPMRQTSGDELKLVWPQDGLDPAQFEACAFTHFFLQPMDGPQRQDALARCVEYCLQNPRWRLSVQLHKALGIK
jgi:organic radical activating enzyme